MGWLAGMLTVAAIIAAAITITLIMLSPRDASGLGDAFGGVGSTLTSSATAANNLDRMTVIAGVTWFVLAAAAGWVLLA